MTVRVALLRGVNVGGHGRIAMSDLREFLSALGCSGVRSMLQSGNVVFRATGRTDLALEQWLEKEAASHLALRTDFFIRTSREWESAIAGNPFPEEAERDPAHLVVLFLKQAPAAPAWMALETAVNGPERIRGAGRHAYAVYPAGIANSRLTNTLIERHLGTRCTGRNWNTVTKLAALAATI